jgi:hypothetical protein
VILTSAWPGDGGPLVVRKRGQWTYEDRPMPDGRRYIATFRADTGEQASVTLAAGGRPDLLVLRHPERGRFSAMRTAPMVRPDETVLGERCAWVDTMPDVADAGRTECRAADGTPLKVVYSARGDARQFTAIKVRRRPVAFAEVMPPPNLMARRLWGLDD